MIEKLKKVKRVLTGKDFFYWPNIKVNTIKLGSSYGGWWVAKDDLKQDKNLVVLSFGLGVDISFDLEIMKQFDAYVHGFDPTPKSIKYIESMDIGEKFILHKYALSDKVGTLTFNLPLNEEHVSGSLENIESSYQIDVKCKGIDTICKDLKISHIDILKMDIEGSEYKVLQDMMEKEIFPSQILVEYHHFFDSFSNSDTLESIDLLLKHGYALFYIDGYNYSFIKQIV